jgi:hypothetical protein
MYLQKGSASGCVPKCHGSRNTAIFAPNVLYCIIWYLSYKPVEVGVCWAFDPEVVFSEVVDGLQR